MTEPPLRRWRNGGVLFPVFGSTILCLLWIAGGCASDSAAGDLDLDALPVLTMQEVSRIGSVDDPDIGFSRVYGADVDADGRLYVFEGADMQIRVYDADGTIVRRIGGRGEGPGEFANGPRWGVHGDTIWAYDFGARRLTLFRRDGTLLSAARAEGVSIPLPGCIGCIAPWSMRPDRLFTGDFAVITCGRDTQSTGVEEGDSIPVPRVLFDATGAVVDTIGWDPSPNPRMVPPAGFSSNRFQSITVGSRRLRVPDPPPELPIWVVLNDGRIIVETPLATDAATGRVLISRLDLEGDTVYHREYCYRPASWTAEGLDSLAARASRGPGAMFAVPSGGPSGSQEPDPAAQRALRAAMTFPEYRLPVQYVERDADGRLWVSRNEPEGSPVRRWALLDEDGLPIGELELPDRARILWSSGDFAWLLVPDEFDVPWLIRYRITMPVG